MDNLGRLFIRWRLVCLTGLDEPSRLTKKTLLATKKKSCLNFFSDFSKYTYNSAKNTKFLAKGNLL